MKIHLSALLATFAMTSLSLGEFLKSKVIDEGGSGPHKAIAASESTLPVHTIYRPRDLVAASEAEGPLPVLFFANGGCSNSSITHERVLSEIASHGYVVIAVGALEMAPDDYPNASTDGDDVMVAIDWIESEAARDGGDYHQRVDLNKMALGGQSCGGAQILSIASDPRVRTYMMFNSGMGEMSMAGANRESLKTVHGPIVYIVGGPSDVATGNAKRDYENIDHVPVAFADLLPGGHMGTFGEEYGGSFSRMALAWLDWQLKGETKHAPIFLKSDLSAFPEWETKSKNFQRARDLQPAEDPEAAGASLKKINELDEFLQSYVDNKKVSSVVGLVAKDSRIIYKKAFGWKDIEKEVPASVDDYYVLFSQTKAVVSAAFMTLVEKGLVAVEDPVAKYFPEISDQVVTKVNEDGSFETRPVSTPMTFAHLLSHSSGLGAGLVGEIRRRERESAEGGRPPRGRSGSLKDGMIDLAKYPLGFDPGSEWNYHISTDMLAYMIEVISKKSLRDYVKETILDPLEMNDTDWYYEGGAGDRFVKIYSVVDGDFEPASNRFGQRPPGEVPTYIGGAIGLNGPISDYARFCQMMLNKGEFNGRRILKPDTVAMMTTVGRLPEKNSGGKGFQFGLGFELYNDVKKPAPQVSDTAYAWGGLYGTRYNIDPDNGTIVLYYINTPRNDEKLYEAFLEKSYQLFDE